MVPDCSSRWVSTIIPTEKQPTKTKFRNSNKKIHQIWKSQQNRNMKRVHAWKNMELESGRDKAKAVAWAGRHMHRLFVKTMREKRRNFFFGSSLHGDGMTVARVHEPLAGVAIPDRLIGRVVESFAHLTPTTHGGREFPVRLDEFRVQTPLHVLVVSRVVFVEVLQVFGQRFHRGEIVDVDVGMWRKNGLRIPKKKLENWKNFKNPAVKEHHCFFVSTRCNWEKFSAKLTKFEGKNLKSLNYSSLL